MSSVVGLWPTFSPLISLRHPPQPPWQRTWLAPVPVHADLVRAKRFSAGDATTTVGSCGFSRRFMIIQMAGIFDQIEAALGFAERWSCGVGQQTPCSGAWA